VAHPFRIREIAQQAGLSQATVDRVLHERPGVRASTVAEVQQAIVELERQRTQVRIGRRTFLLDLVMDAPGRFSSAVRRALESELPALRPAVIRARFHLREDGGVEDTVKALDDIARRGSHGVLLKAQDHPAVVAAIARLADARIPVVTLVTDVPLSRRLAYVGTDNRAAGATAAYLLTQWAGADLSSVLVTLSSSSFRGEEEREVGFRAAMRELAPTAPIRELAETHGLDAVMLETVADALEADLSINAVYSIGGGNRATVEAFAGAGRTCSAFVAHDLDADNTRLLRGRLVSAVLHHDLSADMRRACRLVMQGHGALPGTPQTVPSQIQVITPYNEPVVAWEPDIAG
jgi:LacI family transcriptional regulator, galactose operon repressor